MKIEDQVVSLNLATRLKELNAPQESLFYWLYDIESVTRKDRTLLYYGHIKGIETQYSAFSVAELGELLPSFIDFEGDRYSLEIAKDYDTYTAGYFDNECLKISKSNTLANALAETLIYLIENNLLKL